MPATYIIDKERRLVLSTASGVLTFPDIAGRTDRVKSDPDFVPEYQELFDFTGVTQIELSSPQIRELARWSPYAPSSRRTFLVADELAFGLGRVSASYHFLNDEPNIRVFLDRAEALRWLETGE